MHFSHFSGGGWAAVLTVVGGGLLYLWWHMNRLVGISEEAIMARNFDLARTKLAAVRKPDKLDTPDSKTYYYYFLGTVEAQTGNWKAARQGFKAALEANRFRAVDE